MFARTVVFIAAVVLSGCTTINHIPLSQDASKQLQDKLVVRTTYPTADFAAFTAGKAAFALIGAAAMIAEGNSIVRENNIQDPAIVIGQGLVNQLIAGRNARQVPSQAVATGDDIQTLLATYQGANILVDVKTFNWMFNYYPTDWAHYRVTYSARIRLIDYTSKKVIAETMCRTAQGDDTNPPTKDQLLQDGAALLKNYLTKSATSCIDLVMRNLLLITPTNLEKIGNPIQSVATASMTNSGSDSAKMTDGSQVSGQDIPPTSTDSQEVGERQLMGDEFRSHFVNFGTVTGSSGSISVPLRLSINLNRTYTISYSTRPEPLFGIYRIQNGDSEICLQSTARLFVGKFRDCFQLFDLGGNKFKLRSVTDQTFISYSRS